ncbi:helix-turn-helix transcriptional regulator [Kitasatospora sp. MBT63]|uniref:helix-turn-helix domain-containing protein n=1 Tax=Kitasatospora sp. MBT63 TaxID=1444768 RepID=UPI00053AD173|nr:helix-turn-helix transcriptional regulator [Kitasatospora sp. MBT63]
MSTDFQQARVGLGARLRELRAEAGLSRRDFAARIGWPPSKVSKLEHGKQTPTRGDLEEWARAAGRPEAAGELKGRLQGLESRFRTWRRLLVGGHRARQEAGIAHTRATTVTFGYEPGIVPGIFQIAEYARHVLTHFTDLHDTPRDIEEGVRARLRRQEALYQPGKRFRFIMAEASLYVRICLGDILAAQLDRLTGLLGLDTVELGIVPLGAPVTVVPKHGFWLHDDRLVIVETWNTEMWLEDPENIALYERIWSKLQAAAVYGPSAHRLIVRARQAATTV